LDKNIETYFEGKIVPDKIQIRFVVLHFIGDANIWWEAQKVQDLIPKTWQEFKAALHSYFIPQGYEDEVRLKWDKLRQFHNELVSEYISRFWKTLMSIQTIEVKPEAEQKRKFRSGLLPHLFKELSLFKCDSLNEMIKWTHMIEDRQGNFQKINHNKPSSHSRNRLTNHSSKHLKFNKTNDNFNNHGKN
jgi:hypothetical protein